MARHVADLERSRVLADASDGKCEPETQRTLLRDRRDVNLKGLKIASWLDDGYFPSSRAIQRAVREAAQALSLRGAIVEEIKATWTAEAMEIYFSLLGADGGASLRRLTSGSQLDWRVRRMLTVTGMPRALRHAMVAGLRVGGQRWMASLTDQIRPRSADDYWQLIDRRNTFVRRWLTDMERAGYQAFLLPPHALPAPQHQRAIDLIPAASYSMVPNLLGIPAGTISLTRVRPDEETGRPQTRDTADRQAAATDVGSTGMPIGVQVAALHFREDIVLAIMSALEQDFSARPEFPLRAWVPA
jgi:fatty acid amide hydrolase